MHNGLAALPLIGCTLLEMAFQLLGDALQVDQQLLLQGQ